MIGEPPRGEVRRYKFGFGTLENVELEVWRVEGAEDVTRALLAGQSSVWGFDIYVEIATDPESVWDDPLDDLILGAYKGSRDDADELAVELEAMAYGEWIAEWDRLTGE